MIDTTDIQLLAEFRTETRELLGATDGAFLRLEHEPRDGPSINQIFRAFHTVKGNSAYFGLSRVKEFAHGVETALDRLRKGGLIATPDLIDSMLAAKDHLARLVENCDNLDSVNPERDGTLLQLLQGSSSGTNEVLGQACALLREITDSLKEKGEDLAGLRPLLLRGPTRVHG